jgi:hypothetical protein
MTQGCRGDQGIRKTGLVAPSNLTSAPRKGKMKINVREQGQQVLDFASSSS